MSAATMGDHTLTLAIPAISGGIAFVLLRRLEIGSAVGAEPVREASAAG